MAKTRGEQFGVLLRRLRRAAGLTQEELAERAGTSARTISDIERGVSNAPYRATIEALADALGLDDERRAEMHAAGARRRGPKRVEAPREAASPIPREPNALLGRERDEAEILHALRFEGVRMLTITGAGGVGKTRLALRVAERMRGDVPSLHFVPLVTVGEPALVPTRTAQGIGLEPGGSEAAEELLARHLQGQEALLVLDNLEQVTAIGPYLARLLERAPGLRLLVTSREPLRVRAEREYPLAPLALPDGERLPPAERLAEYPAIALFLDRARAVRPDFRLTQENAATVGAICARLDGLPLAIELAAAWIRTLSPQALLLRLDRPLRILRDGPRDLPPRQQTMRDTVAWSYGLLAPTEALLFRRLAVFAGGAELEAVEAICGEPGGDVTADLSALTAKSLVVAPRGEDEGRWSMLETIREFATEELDASDEANSVRRRHRDHYRALARDADAGLYDERQERSIRVLELERDNLRAAFEWSLSMPGEGQGALEMATDLAPYWQIRGYLEEGGDMFARVLAQVQDVGGEPLAAALNGAANVENLRGRHERATELYNRALALFRELGMTARAATVLGNLAVLAEWQERPADAHRLYADALAAHREIGDRDGVARTLLNWVQIVADEGDLDRAETMIEEALAFYKERRDLRNTAGCLSGLAYVADLRGDAHRALVMRRAALRRLVEVGVYSDLVGELETVAHMLDDPVTAVSVLGACSRLREDVGRPLPPNERAREEERTAALRAALGQEAFERAWREGRAFTPEAAVQLALERSAEEPVAPALRSGGQFS